jgi:serine/threonine protein kinase
MKSATFGLSTASLGALFALEIGPCWGTPPPLATRHPLEAAAALSSYMECRTNGEACDKPTKAFPADGTYSWQEAGTDDSYHVKYTEGPGDRKWMAQFDRNYLARQGVEKTTAGKQECEARLGNDSSHIFPHSRFTFGPKAGFGYDSSHIVPYSRFTFGPKLWSGEFGDVFLGESHQIQIVIKKLRMKNMSPKILEEFKNEAGILARLDSPHTVQLYGITLSPEFTILMEYLPKGSLYDVLRSEQTLSWFTRSQIALDISTGLAFLHAEGILHQALKSLNVLLDNEYRAKLADFGFSKIKRESSRTTSTVAQSIGTLRWKAPELFEHGSKYNTACDIHSLGMTLWEVCSGKLPFADAQDNDQIATWIMQGKQETIPAETLEHLKVTIQACWALDPTKRPTAAQVVSSLTTSVNTDQDYPLHTSQASSSNAETGGYSLDSPSSATPPPIPPTPFFAELTQPLSWTPEPTHRRTFAQHVRSFKTSVNTDHDYPWHDLQTGSSNGGYAAGSLSFFPEDDEKEQPLQAGAQVRVYECQSADWWWCEYDGQGGLLPSQYLHVSSNQHEEREPLGDYTGYTTPTNAEALGTAGIFTAATPNLTTTNQFGAPGAGEDDQLTLDNKPLS